MESLTSQFTFTETPDFGLRMRFRALAENAYNKAAVAPCTIPKSAASSDRPANPSTISSPVMANVFAMNAAGNK